MDAVRRYRGPGARWKAVGPWIGMTVLFGGVLVAGAITSPGARALSLTGAALVFCAGSAVTIWSLRAAGIGVTADHLVVWDAAGTRHLIAWPSVAGFDLEKWHGVHGSSGLTLIVICSDGRRLHTSGCSFSGTGERSWATARQMVQALEAERQARTPRSTGL
jgi:hypothetical protein